MSEVKVGTKVEGFWGAMYPTWAGKVIAINIDEDGFTREATIEWYIDTTCPGQDTQVTKVENIHQPGWTSVNGSPIGIFIDEVLS